MQIYITDKTGRKFWNTNVSACYSNGERKNLKRHMRNIKSGSPAYARIGIDSESAHIVEMLDSFDIELAGKLNVGEMTVEELLKELSS